MMKLSGCMQHVKYLVLMRKNRAWEKKKMRNETEGRRGGQRRRAKLRRRRRRSRDVRREGGGIRWMLAGNPGEGGR